MKQGFTYDIKYTNITKAGAVLPFNFISMELAKERANGEMINQMLSNIYKLVDDFHLANEQRLITLVFQEDVNNELKNLLLKDSEYGGSFIPLKTNKLGEFIMTIVDKHTDNTKTICNVSMGNTNSIMFHTHPYTCIKAYDAILSIPSATDMAISFDYSLRNVIAQERNSFLHIVVAEEGLYKIKLEESFSGIFRKYLQRFNTDIEKYQVIKIFSEVILHLAIHINQYTHYIAQKKKYRRYDRFHT